MKRLGLASCFPKIDPAPDSGFELLKELGESALNIGIKLSPAGFAVSILTFSSFLCSAWPCKLLVKILEAIDSSPEPFKKLLKGFAGLEFGWVV